MRSAGLVRHLSGRIYAWITRGTGATRYQTALISDEMGESIKDMLNLREGMKLDIDRHRRPTHEGLSA